MGLKDFVPTAVSRDDGVMMSLIKNRNQYDNPKQIAKSISSDLQAKRSI
jgi:hypothetical protein